MIVVETLPVAYSSISVDYLKPYGDRNWFYFFFSSMRGCEDSSMYILFFLAPCNRNAGYLPLKGLIIQLLGECWRAISIVPSLRSFSLSVGDV